MAITTKKPAEKLTVGAQYICFDTASDGTYSGTYAEDVTCLPTVTQVEAMSMRPETGRCISRSRRPTLPLRTP